mmetsp:Transcript_9167/g.15145  ORF Transcript_9167/g.15145 Transcript_9167/m.15145 type:complete len:118 (-) Transcript_9167:139-492(-)
MHPIAAAAAGAAARAVEIPASLLQNPSASAPHVKAQRSLAAVVPQLQCGGSRHGHGLCCSNGVPVRNRLREAGGGVPTLRTTLLVIEARLIGQRLTASPPILPSMVDLATPAGRCLD